MGCCCDMFSALQGADATYSRHLCKIFWRTPKNVEIKIKIGKNFLYSILVTSENVVYSGFYYINYGNCLAFPNVRAPEDLERGSSFSDFDFFYAARSHW